MPEPAMTTAALPREMRALASPRSRTAMPAGRMPANWPAFADLVPDARTPGAGRRARAGSPEPDDGPAAAVGLALAAPPGGMPAPAEAEAGTAGMDRTGPKPGKPASAAPEAAGSGEPPGLRMGETAPQAAAEEPAGPDDERGAYAPSRDREAGTEPVGAPREPAPALDATALARRQPPLQPGEGRNAAGSTAVAPMHGPLPPPVAGSARQAPVAIPARSEATAGGVASASAPRAPRQTAKTARLPALRAAAAPAPPQPAGGAASAPTPAGRAAANASPTPARAEARPAETRTGAATAQHRAASGPAGIRGIGIGFPAASRIALRLDVAGPALADRIRSETGRLRLDLAEVGAELDAVRIVLSGETMSTDAEGPAETRGGGSGAGRVAGAGAGLAGAGVGLAGSLAGGLGGNIGGSIGGLRGESLSATAAPAAAGEAAGDGPQRSAGRRAGDAGPAAPSNPAEIAQRQEEVSAATGPAAPDGSMAQEEAGAVGGPAREQEGGRDDVKPGPTTEPDTDSAAGGTDSAAGGTDSAAGKGDPRRNETAPAHAPDDHPAAAAARAGTRAAGADQGRRMPAIDHPQGAAAAAPSGTRVDRLA